MCTHRTIINDVWWHCSYHKISCPFHQEWFSGSGKDEANDVRLNPFSTVTLLVVWQEGLSTQLHKNLLQWFCIEKQLAVVAFLSHSGNAVFVHFVCNVFNSTENETMYINIPQSTSNSHQSSIMYHIQNKLLLITTLKLYAQPEWQFCKMVGLKHIWPYN